jgi:gluconolactonase
LRFFQLNAEPFVRIDAVEVFAEGLDHPEGLAFDEDGILWAGGEAGQLYSIAPNGQVTTVATTGGFFLGVTVSPEQELYICDAGKHALLRMDRKGNVLQTMDRVAGHALRNPNFSLFDRRGSLYFSDSGTWSKQDGHVFCIRPDGATEVFASSLSFPNGMALSPDGAALLVVESTRDRVLRIPILPDGTAGKAEIYAAGMERVPDGLAFDAAGNLFVTCYATDCIYRVAPDGAAELFVFDPEGTRIARPTNIAFGGADGRDMYIANLGRWHISRLRAEHPGLPLLDRAKKGNS